jgi:hypothetical protein
MISMPLVHLDKTMYLSIIGLTLSLNGPKRASTWPTSPSSTIGWAQNDFEAHGTFSANRAPMLRRDWHYLQMVQNELPLDTCHLGVPSGVPKMISMPVVHSAQIVHQSCVRLTLSPNGPKQASTWHTLHGSMIGCAQSDFHARGTLGANRTPILLLD